MDTVRRRHGDHPDDEPTGRLQHSANHHRQNDVNFGANASAIIANSGAANARFVNGVAVFIRPITGAMAEASLGGQRITYVPK
jgi:hypothetical protein